MNVIKLLDEGVRAKRQIFKKIISVRARLITNWEINHRPPTNFILQEETLDSVLQQSHRQKPVTGLVTCFNNMNSWG